jgi:DNA-binding transcriptional MerR regulator
MTEPKQRRDLILHRPEHALAEEHGISLAEVRAILDEHPVERDRDTYLRRALAQQLLLLDRLEVTFGRMAFEDRDTAAGALLVKVAERKATLLGMNAPIGHAVRVVSHPPDHRVTSTDKIERALNALIEDGKRSQNGRGEPH